jgi:dTDP-4-amino-4,6-dideoxygalactose transaminase
MSAAAIQNCVSNSSRLWLYVGSVQTLEYNLYKELRRKSAEQGVILTKQQQFLRVQSLLSAFSEDKHWLSALAGEGDVFDSDDPENEQLIRSLGRFQSGTIKLLTRDKPLLKTYPEKTLSPVQYCQLPTEKSKLPFINLQSQQDALRPQLEKRIHKVLHHGKYILGPEVQELEEKLADYVGVKHAITCANGTDALSLALMTLDIGQGDAVFCPLLPFLPQRKSLFWLVPLLIFVDSDLSTYNFCPIDLEKKVKRTLTQGKTVPKAIIAVDLFGLPANYPELDKIAEKYDLKIVEDAAQGFGGEIEGKMACSFGDISTTSFFPAKPLGCYGDGGAIFTNSDEYAELIKSYRVHGKGRDKYDNVRIGLNSRLDTLQAAIILEKLAALPSELIAKRHLAQYYSKELKEICSVQNIPNNYESAWAQYTLVSPERDKVIDQLRSRGIPSMIYYGTCMHQQTALRVETPSDLDFPVASTLSKEVFSIPMNPYLKGSDRIRIVDTLNHNN